MKYLRHYLWLTMSTTARREALAGHYRRLNALAQTSAPYLLRRNRIPIWENDDCECSLNIILEPAKLTYLEGELQLGFSYNDIAIFTLTFSLIPGSVIGAAHDTVIFIGGFQGGLNRRREIRLASKCNGEISPATMLLICIEAISSHFNIEKIFAVAEDRHISLSYVTEDLNLKYPLYWFQAKGQRTGEVYQLFGEVPSKPLADIPIAHRPRTRRKRERKTCIRETIDANLQRLSSEV